MLVSINYTEKIELEVSIDYPEPDFKILNIWYQDKAVKNIKPSNRQIIFDQIEKQEVL